MPAIQKYGPWIWSPVFAGVLELIGGIYEHQMTLRAFLLMTVAGWIGVLFGKCILGYKDKL